jgi:hypothetical protein
VSACAVHAKRYMVSLPSPVVHIPIFVIVRAGQQMLRRSFITTRLQRKVEKPQMVDAKRGARSPLECQAVCNKISSSRILPSLGNRSLVDG